MVVVVHEAAPRNAALISERRALSIEFKTSVRYEGETATEPVQLSIFGNPVIGVFVSFVQLHHDDEDSTC